MLSRPGARQEHFAITNILLGVRCGGKSRPVFEQQGISECLNG